MANGTTGIRLTANRTSGYNTVAGGTTRNDTDRVTPVGALRRLLSRIDQRPKTRALAELAARRTPPGQPALRLGREPAESALRTRLETQPPCARCSGEHR